MGRNNEGEKSHRGREGGNVRERERERENGQERTEKVENRKQGNQEGWWDKEKNTVKEEKGK